MTKQRDVSLIYRSVSNLSEYDAQDREILEIARARNSKHGVTGYLHKQNYFFCQYLEGPEDAVQSIYTSIQNDNRHSHVTLLGLKECTQRLFKEWDMGYSSTLDPESSKHFRTTIANTNDVASLSEHAWRFFERVSKTTRSIEANDNSVLRSTRRHTSPD